MPIARRVALFLPAALLLAACAALFRVDEVGYASGDGPLEDASADRPDAEADDGDSDRDLCPAVDAAAFLGVVEGLSVPGTQACGDAGKPENLAADPNNCGYCGHSCGQAACVNGYCSAEFLAPDRNDYVRVFGRDDASVYWVKTAYGFGPNTTSVIVMRVAFDNDGGEGTTIFDGSDLIGGVAALRDGVVFLGTRATSGGVQAVDVDSGIATMLAAGDVVGIAVNSSRVAWIEGSDPRVRAVPRQGGPVSELAHAAAQPWAIVADDERAIWNEADVVDAGDAGSALVGMALGEHVFATGERHEYARAAAPQLLTSDSRYVYWADAATQRVYRTPKSKLDEDVAIGSLPPGEGAVSAMMVDGRWVYVLTGAPDTTDRRLMVVPKCGDRPARVLGGAIAHRFTDIVADAKFVYFASYVEPRGIWRMAKP